MATSATAHEVTDSDGITESERPTTSRVLEVARIPDHRPPVIRWLAPAPPPVEMMPLPLEWETGIHTSPQAEHLRAEDLRALQDFTRHLVQAILDAIMGRRAISQLVRWVDDVVLADLTFRSRLHKRNPQPLLLRSLRLQALSPEYAEAAARITVGRRSVAAAFRLDREAARWVCTVADFGPHKPTRDIPPGPPGRTSRARA